MVLLIASSALLKLALLWPAAGSPLDSDELRYLEAARTIPTLGVPVYSNPRWDEAHASPVMPYSMAACYVLFGEQSFQTAARIAQIVLNSLTVMFVFAAALRAFDRRVALLTAGFTAFYPTLVAYTHYFYTETVYIFFLTALVAVLLRPGQRIGLRRALFAGVIGGLTALTRSAFLTHAPLVALWMYFCAGGPRMRRASAVAAFVAGMIVVIAPWTFTNWARYDRFLLIDTNAGNVVWKNLNAVRPENADLGLSTIRKSQVRLDGGGVPIRPRVEADNIVDRNNAELRAAVRFVFAHPVLYLKNCVIRAAEMVNPTSFLVRRIRVPTRYVGLPPWLAELIVCATVASTLFVLACGVIGIASRVPTAQQTLMILLIVANATICILVISSSRYRLPMMPLLIPFAIDGALGLRSRLRLRAHRRTWLVAGPPIAAMVVAWVLYLPLSFPYLQTVNRPNIVLISIDSLRADHLAYYGHSRDTGPAIDRIGTRGVAFANAVAQAPWTLPSHVSLLTSLYPRTHQVNDPSQRLAPGTDTLAAVLKSAGYATHAIVSGPFMQARFGLDQGFDTYDDSRAQGSHRKSHGAITSPEITAGAVRLLESVQRPYFLFLHYWDVHYDYIPPAPFDTKFDPDYAGAISSADFMRSPAIHADMNPRDLEHLLALYDGEIAWVNSQIRGLLRELKQRSDFDDTIIVVTADHGDEFFEHGEKGHQHSLYQELLHVPLFMRIPGVERGTTVSQRVQLIDVMPTLLDAAGMPAPHTLQGRSLLPLVQGRPRSNSLCFAETTKARKTREVKLRSRAWCVYDGPFKLILYDRNRYPLELYNLVEDPGEQTNLIGVAPHAGILAKLHHWLETTPENVSVPHEGLDQDTMRELRSLGYLDGEQETED